jgi:hypothetical protein
MPQSSLWVVFVAVIAVALIAWVYLSRQHTARLRKHYGPEYDRLIDEKGHRSRAEAELDQRSKRVERLSIRPLAPDRRDRYSARWKEQQARFVDEPKAAIEDADHLVEEVMTERGYPVGEFEQRVADISVDHPRVVQNYRAAHDIAMRERTGQATTEDLRRAMLFYRDLFMDLLDDASMRGAPSR